MRNVDSDQSRCNSHIIACNCTETLEKNNTQNDTFLYTGKIMYCIDEHETSQ